MQGEHQYGKVATVGLPQKFTINSINITISIIQIYNTRKLYCHKSYKWKFVFWYTQPRSLTYSKCTNLTTTLIASSYCHYYCYFNFHAFELCYIFSILFNTFLSPLLLFIYSLHWKVCNSTGVAYVTNCDTFDFQKENIKTIPNLLTATRMASAPLLGYMVMCEHFVWALGIFVFAGITDVVSQSICLSVCCLAVYLVPVFHLFIPAPLLLSPNQTTTSSFTDVC